MHDGRVRHLLFYWTIYMAPPKHVIHFSTRPYARTSFFLRHFMHLMDSRRYRDDRTWRERWVMTCKKGPWPDTILGCCTSYGWRLFKYFFGGGGSSCDHERDGNPYLCPDSWAMVNARPRPVSSLMVQLLYLLHIPLIGAKPAKPARQCVLHQSYFISYNSVSSNTNSN